MPRYEFVEGTSSKFWEIERAKDGKSYTVRWGRIGTEGQSKTKKHKDRYTCTAEYEKLVAEKLRKGYEIAGEKKPAAKATAAAKTKPKPGAAKQNAELEDSIAEDPDDESRWLVYADWLQQAGDVRGEIIALSAAKKKAAAQKLAAANADALWGDAKALSEPDPFANVTWMPGWSGAKKMPLAVSVDLGFGKYGLVDSVSVSGLDEEGHVAKALHSLIAAPIGRFVRSIRMEAAREERYSGTSGQPNFELVVAAIARAKPGALRSFSLGPEGWQLSWTQTGNLSPLWKAAPRLESIFIEMGSIDLGKEMDLPKLKSLHLQTGGLARKNLALIGKTKWPSLTDLTIYFGRKDYGGDARRADVAALLAKPGNFPKLVNLGLCNAEIQGDVVAEIAKSPLLAQLETLDLSRGTLIDEEAQPILENLVRFKKLKKLNLAENYLSDDMEKTLRKAFGKAFTGGSRYEEMVSERDQHANDDWAKDYTFRYTAVGE